MAFDVQRRCILLIGLSQLGQMALPLTKIAIHRAILLISSTASIAYF